jgi:hypothetical protein
MTWPLILTLQGGNPSVDRESYRYRIWTVGLRHVGSTDFSDRVIEVNKRPVQITAIS